MSLPEPPPPVQAVTTPPKAPPKVPSERAIVFLIGAVQFVNVLDFMMVMPLGPDLSPALHFPLSQLGLLGTSYAAAAAVSGMLGAVYLDRFDRRSALAVALLGLVLGTAAGGLATGLPSMLLARVIAGLFGGPATSLSMSALTDVVPVERRGRALGSVMGAFSVASVFGVPTGLYLARHGGWRMPFLGVAALGLVIGALAVVLLPPLRSHLEKRAGAPAHASPLQIMRRPESMLSLVTSATVMLTSFALVPNIAAYLQHNCGLPRQDLEYLYAIGGVFSFISMRLLGRLVDRFGAPIVSVFGTLLLVTDQALGFLPGRALIPIPVLFVCFMVAQAARAVSLNTTTTRVPRPDERARYQSIQSAVQHLASGLGASLGTLLLTVTPEGRLEGMPRLTVVSMVLALQLPPLLMLIQDRLRRRDQDAELAEHPPLPSHPHHH